MNFIIIIWYIIDKHSSYCSEFVIAFITSLKRFIKIKSVIFLRQTKYLLSLSNLVFTFMVNTITSKVFRLFATTIEVACGAQNVMRPLTMRQKSARSIFKNVFPDLLLKLWISMHINKLICIYCQCKDNNNSSNTLLNKTSLFYLF